MQASVESIVELQEFLIKEPLPCIIVEDFEFPIILKSPDNIELSQVL